MSRKKVDFIERAISVHGNKYDYSKSVYTGMHNKVIITCPIHGDFEQEAHAHLKGQGCPKCALESRTAKRKDNKESFIEKARKIHGDKYDYSKVKYRSSQEKVCIICPKHGEFWIKPYLHIQGHGCSECWEENRKFAKLYDTDTFIEKAKKVHGDKYDYSKVNYINTNTKVCIICQEHGEFWQTPNSHINGSGCPKCGVKKSHKVMTNDEFINKARKIHGDKYDYSKTEYISPFKSVTITCPIHGDFKQKPSYHLSGNGCQKCAVLESKWEQEVYEFIKGMYNDAINGERSILEGFEIDVYVPSKKIGFECDGLFWHNELNKEKNYHLNKTNECKNKGIQLIHIFEDEWIYKKEIVKNRIKSILGNNDEIIYARNCKVVELDYNNVSTFMDENHLQGKTPSTYYYGLLYEGELVAVMSFGNKRKNLGSKPKLGYYELIRFCTKGGINIIGGASKLMNHFIKTINPEEIISYCDLRWSNGGMYEKLGFQLDHISQPNYYYVIGDKRKNRFNYRKDVLIKEGFDNGKTEHQIMLERKIYRIYDCGTLVYKYCKK